MKIRGQERLRGDVDPVDLIAGIIIAVAIPLLATFMFSSFGGSAEAPSVRQLAEDSKNVRARPDGEYIQLKLDYVGKIYNETGKEFMRRSQVSSGVQRMNEREWGAKCFRALISELSSLESELSKDADLRSRYGGRLQEIANLKDRIQGDLLAISQ
ncbi:MAG: hypothetical protein VX288_10040 [Planctomycetota bacterium]|nr:hypothetical protein [Planctomycetota bacterium]